MTFRVEARLASPGSAQRILQRKLSDRVRRDLNDVGRTAVKLANDKMDQRFDMNRPGDRRRHPGSRRAKGALSYQIDGSELPFTVRYRVLGGDEVVRRIAGLNWGTPYHEITPSGNAGGNGLILAWDDGIGWVQAKRVGHPGSRKGVGFLEEAMTEAFQRVLIR
jgi:hypothetical protein